jgi:hypothetical protein
MTTAERTRVAIGTPRHAPAGFFAVSIHLREWVTRESAETHGWSNG